MKLNNSINRDSTPNHSEEEPDFCNTSCGRSLNFDEGALRAAHNFAFRVPRVFSELIHWRDPQDPILLQVMPSALELTTPPGFTADPLEEAQFLKAPGLLVKYARRVLMRLTGQCPIHCRYCFRRHDTFQDVPTQGDAWRPALEWIRREPSIQEVIFSGGDPLMVANDDLLALTTELQTMGHLKRLRLHTRMPVCSPGRINNGFLVWLTELKLTPIIIIHVNHPNELGREGCAALARLAAAGVTLLNQSVLLKGVNDSVAVLEALSDILVQNRVVPYYLHLLDPVAGAAHFRVDEALARSLLRTLRQRLPGYAVPRLARERPRHPAKEVLEA
ncbi:MAG: KamA family radical SAM protein [Magnetococcales bacterium]|nr:KamA family radical SAM protein [Magnetococcales bacterium]